MGMKFHPLKLAGAYHIRRERHEDRRGHFSRIYCSKIWETQELDGSFVQLNHSFNRTRGTIRGLHFQYPPCTENRLVTCLTGRVFDVIVDLRRDSPTFLDWVALELAAQEGDSVFVPKGFAHGFQTLEDDTHLLYNHSEYYSPEHEGALRYDDPALAIPWPLACTVLSDRDASVPLMDPAVFGFELRGGSSGQSSSEQNST